MTILFAVFSLVLLDAPPAPSAALPTVLQGIWMADSRQCRRHAAALRSGDGDQIIGALVGAVVIEGDLLHDVAEYGEGNFYRTTVVAQQGRGRWIMQSLIGIDAIPDGSDTYQTRSFDVTVRGNRMALAFADRPTAASYVRCPQRSAQSSTR